jgi:hypothetical protein
MVMDAVHLIPHGANPQAHREDRRCPCSPCSAGRTLAGVTVWRHRDPSTKLIVTRPNLPKPAQRPGVGLPAEHRRSPGPIANGTRTFAELPRDPATGRVLPRAARPDEGAE